jgi:hypothetical protein
MFPDLEEHYIGLDDDDAWKYYLATFDFLKRIGFLENYDANPAYVTLVLNLTVYNEFKEAIKETYNKGSLAEPDKEQITELSKKQDGLGVWEKMQKLHKTRYLTGCEKLKSRSKKID